MFCRVNISGIGFLTSIVYMTLYIETLACFVNYSFWWWLSNKVEILVSYTRTVLTHIWSFPRCLYFSEYVLFYIYIIIQDPTPFWFYFLLLETYICICIYICIYTYIYIYIYTCICICIYTYTRIYI